MRIKLYILIATTLFLAQACKEKEEKPSLQFGAVTDIDGNTYKTIQIGTQTWMAENLKVTSCNDSTNIPKIANSQEWNKTTEPAYCNYNNSENVNEYGRLYNWYAVNTGKICPQGFHVPTRNDWKIFDTYLGDTTTALQLKESEWDHWAYAETAEISTNESLFTALPGGQCSVLGLYDYQGKVGYWWTSSEASYTGASAIEINYYNSKLEYSDVSKTYGFSVRCVKD